VDGGLLDVSPEGVKSSGERRQTGAKKGRPAQAGFHFGEFTGGEMSRPLPFVFLPRIIRRSLFNIHH